MAVYLQLIVAGLSVGAVYALVALGYHMVYRATGIIDFAQGEKVAVGGLLVLSLISRAHLPFWLAVLVSTLAGAAIGWLYERGIMRFTYHRSEVTAIIATVGAALIFLRGHELIWGREGLPFPAFSPEAQPLHLGQVAVDVQDLWIAGLLIIVLLGLYLFFQRTLRGQAAVAAAADPLGAALTGIDVPRARSIAFCLATAMAVLAGIVVAPMTLAGGQIGTPIGLKGFAGAVVGGLDSPAGVVLGSLLVGVVENLAAGFFGYGYRDPVAFALLILMLLLRPAGLFGPRRRTREA